MRIRYAAPGIGLLVLGCVAVFGADSWREKAPADWTADEVKKILNDSPWSQQVRMEMGEPGGGRMGRGGGMGGPGGGWGGRGGGMGGPGGGYGGGGMGGPGGGGGGWGGNRGGGQGGEPGGGGPREVLVRWQSAFPVQQALAKQSETPTAAAPAATDSEYIIAVSGLPDWSGRRRRNADGDTSTSQDNSGASDEDRRQAFLDRMKESTTLTPKGKSPFGPDKVERAADGTILLYFPKAEEALSLDDREVDFATRLGPMELKHKFKLKDMTYQGKLAL